MNFKQNMKIKVGKKIFKLSDACCWSLKKTEENYAKVSGGVNLYNRNTKRFESVDGDFIEIHRNGKFIRTHVIGYTCGQIVPTEDGTFVLSHDELYSGSFNIRKRFHNIELIND